VIEHRVLVRSADAGLFLGRARAARRPRPRRASHVPLLGWSFPRTVENQTKNQNGTIVVRQRCERGGRRRRIAEPLGGVCRGPRR
jgi:hypothetical protein